MTFDDITGDGKLWAVRYNEEDDNALYSILRQWYDISWLRAFFKENIKDLASYFKITDVNEAIYDTLEDAERLQCLIMDLSPEADLGQIFRHLEPTRFSEMILSKEKARIENRPRHASWLRIYAIKLAEGIYIITGGSIQLTATMQERAHTLAELGRMEKVRNYLISENIIDEDSFDDYLEES